MKSNPSEHKPASTVMILLACNIRSSRPQSRAPTGKRFPPGKKKLTTNEVAVIGRWIAAGARGARPEPQEIATGLQITPEERAFWSFQPIRRPAVPKVEAASRVRTPIDAFLLARLEEKK